MNKDTTNHLILVGDTNSGKSTLINRFIGRNLAVSHHTETTTRDIVEYTFEWGDRCIKCYDTGGLTDKKDGLDITIRKQLFNIIDKSHYILFICDARIGISSSNLLMRDYLLKLNKNVILLVNKIDNPEMDYLADSFWKVGFGKPYPISGLHGYNVRSVLDIICERIEKDKSINNINEDVKNKIILIGKPNCGKSTLFNQLVKDYRSIVSDKPHTTVDPITSLCYSRDNTSIELIDTAGIDRQVHKKFGTIDSYAYLRTEKKLQDSDCALIMIDATVSASEQDRRLLSLVHKFHVPSILILNKWDKISFDIKRDLEYTLYSNKLNLQWIPLIKISALTGYNVNKLFKLIDNVIDNAQFRFKTSVLNEIIERAIVKYPHPKRGGKKRIKILYATQVDIKPPKIMLFTNGNLESSYIRYIEKCIRLEYQFVGVPIHIVVKVKNEES